MKRALLIVLGMLIVLPTLARDFTFEYEGQTLIYTVISEEEKTVETKEGIEYEYTPGNEVSGVLSIPSQVIDNGKVYTVTSIGDFAFYDCSGLTSVTIPNSVTEIGDFAFRGCSGLTSMIIPNSVTSIGDIAFDCCSGLTSVTIGNSVTEIGTYAFGDCTSLTSVTIPNSVTKIFHYAFRGCTSLTSVTIPNSVALITPGTFKDCSGLTSVTIPNSVTEIGAYAFSGCSGLTSVTIGNSVTEIGEYAFENCTSLTSVTIPNSVTTIGYSAFQGCCGLTSVTIPNSVTEIGFSAFQGCDGLAKIYYNTADPIITTEDVFDSTTYRNATLYVQEAAVEKCKYTSPWSKFSNLQAFDFSGIEEIITELDTDAPYIIYNLNGVKISDNIDALLPGLYIVRQGNIAKKITVK